MMKFAVSIFGLLVLVACSCSSDRDHGQEKHAIDEDCVYVCAGRKAKRYHSVDDCKGLTKCSGRVVEVTLEEAEEMGKTPCRMCVKQ